MNNQEFWSGYQPGLRFARSPVGTSDFFAEVTEQRYELEPHIAEVVRFERWKGRKVLEAGCGIGTDGARFAAAGARYTGVDFSPAALALARRRFDSERLSGAFVSAAITSLPFPDNAFDLVFSHGVIHHIPNTEAAVREFHRVLKPGGTVLVMVYHRRSFNYYVTLMLIRRLFAALLLIPGASAAVSRLTGEPEEVVEGHRYLLSEHGFRYLTDRELFLSNNTDGPGNPLSKVYTRGELCRLFSPGFHVMGTTVRYLNLRLYPGGARLVRTRLARQMERAIGWHLYVEGVKR